MKNENFFVSGFRAILPITVGIIPFGAVVGTISSEAGFSFFQSFGANVILYAGASQLAATELTIKHAAGPVIILTGLIINLRFLLYSAAMSPVLQRSSWGVKVLCAHFLTDQGYAVMAANMEKFKNNTEAIWFYLGSCAAMMLVWHSAFIGGYAFGNFAPAAWSLDFGVPLSFAALVIPSLKNRRYVFVALFSCAVSILLYPLPYRIGLFLTALLSIGLGTWLSRAKGAA